MLPRSVPAPAVSAGSRPTRVLVVEDEQKVADALHEGLEGEGYRVTTDRTGEQALAHISNEHFDIIVLDLMLPGRDGLDILTALRRKNINVRVLVLTARDSLKDRVFGLDAGADDYLVKPFAFAELLARLRALGRRERIADADQLLVDTLEIDRVARRVTRSGQTIELTTKEFALLSSLARQTPQVVSRDTLAREAWSETARSTTLDNIIDVHISRLRRKIDMESEAKLIHTVRGVGFALRMDNA